MALILGIDPGSRKTGFGIINSVGQRMEYVTSGCIRVVDLPTFPERLHRIFQGISSLIEQYSPDEMAIEQVFLGRNADSALKLGQARGSAIIAGMQGGLEVHEYAAKKVKQAVVGRGSADKSQIQHMMMALLKLPGLPQEDAADALAIAVCHAHTRQSLIKMSGVRHSRRGRLLGATTK